MSKKLTSETVLAFLGDLATKGHQEFNGVLDTLRKQMQSPSVFTVDFISPEKVSAEYRFTPEGFTFVAQADDDKRYEVNLPLNPQASGASVVLTDPSQGQKISLFGTDVFDDKGIPEEFKGLHARIAVLIRNALPAELLEKLTNTAHHEPTVGNLHTSEATALQATGLSGEVSGQPPEPQLQSQEAQEFVIRRDNEPNLRFRGQHLASTRTALWRGRYFAYDVFQTIGGRFIAVKQGLSLWPSERTRVETAVVDQVEELVPFFGHSLLAKSIYSQLNLTTDQVID